jgi:hypothetical protein
MTNPAGGDERPAPLNPAAVDPPPAPLNPAAVEPPPAPLNPAAVEQGPPNNQPAIEQLLANAGVALQAVAAQNTGPAQPFGWRLQLDAPRWALRKDKDRGYRPALLLAFGAVLVGGALFGLLLVWRDNSDSNTNVTALSDTTLTALAVGLGACALALALISWRAIASWRSISMLHVDVSRTVPASVEITYASGNRQNGDLALTQGDTPPKSVQETRQKTVGTEDASGSRRASPLSVVAKEPVLVGSTLLGGGTLALGLSGGVGGDALAAIVASAITVGGLLVRQLVTTLADPKDHQNRPLAPAGSQSS